MKGAVEYFKATNEVQIRNMVNTDEEKYIKVKLKELKLFEEEF